MTDTISTAVAVEIFPDEFRPILKLLNLALMCKEVTDCMSQAEVHKIYAFKDDFANTALEFAE
jgi:hypothetical protein